MNILKSFGKPEYFFRPPQILRRLAREVDRVPMHADITLPWGLPLRIHPGETIGSCIWRTGVYDICVSECLWRLLDPGETAFDVGANIGYMTSLLSCRAGPRGRVVAFEPHPEICTDLRTNVSLWAPFAGLAPVEVIESALSRNDGHAVLHVPSDFASNRGIASLERQGQQTGFQRHEIRTMSLDSMVASSTAQSIHVMKVDVEGHELDVFTGADGLLARKAVRDIIFEEHRSPPTPVTDYLRTRGYSLFHLDSRFHRPDIVPVGGAHESRRRDAVSLLATAEPERALKRLAAIGWQLLRNRRPTVTG